MVAVSAVTVATVALAACTGSSSTTKSSSASGPAGASTTASPAGPSSSKTGGTIYYSDGTRDVEHWDPQRVYIGRDIADESRLFTRTLVQYGTGAGSSSNAIHPDLATNLGVSSNANKTWKFTLKTGIDWQDGAGI